MSHKELYRSPVQELPSTILRTPQGTGFLTLDNGNLSVSTEFPSRKIPPFDINPILVNWDEAQRCIWLSDQEFNWLAGSSKTDINAFVDPIARYKEALYAYVTSVEYDGIYGSTPIDAILADNPQKLDWVPCVSYQIGRLGLNINYGVLPEASVLFKIRYDDKDEFQLTPYSVVTDNGTLISEHDDFDRQNLILIVFQDLGLTVESTEHGFTVEDEIRGGKLCIGEANLPLAARYVKDDLELSTPYFYDLTFHKALADLSWMTSLVIAGGSKKRKK